MKVFRRTAIGFVLLLGLLGISGVVVTRYWFNATVREARIASADTTGQVDEQPLVTAQKLAAFAVTPEEQELAHAALQVADHEVDLTYTSALRNATLHPAPLSPAMQTLVTRIDGIQDVVKAEEKDIARVKDLLARAGDKDKPRLEEELQLQQAMLEVEQEDLEASRQELIRAGGDPGSNIQRLMEQHQAQKQAQAAASAAPKTPQQQVESRTVLVQWRVWRQRAATEQELTIARQQVQQRSAALAVEHETLVQGQKAENPSPTTAPAPAAWKETSQNTAETFLTFKQVAEEQRNLSELDKRAADLKQLDSIYSQWSAIVVADKQVHLMELLEGVAWIVALLSLVVLADPLLRLVLAQLTRQSRSRHTVRIVLRFVLQAMGIGLILLVIIGPPNQLATVLALAGAGLTVALKDFIVAFFGWFTLMGSNGIRPGDWVEINGIGGEVLEVGLLHTVLLETGNWSDAGHPTGRKVTFVNSFAIEGHYFNFSTTGQWLWDQIEVPIPAGADPYPIAEAVQKDVLEETTQNMRLAEQEWQRVVPGHVARNFSASPGVSVRPTSQGVNVIVRYITRAHERYETRTRLFYRIVEQLRSMQIPHPPIETTSAKGAIREISAAGSR
jgi:small-conductance mechanosensitive channel